MTHPHLQRWCTQPRNGILANICVDGLYKRSLLFCQQTYSSSDISQSLRTHCRETESQNLPSFFIDTSVFCWIESFASLHKPRARMKWCLFVSALNACQARNGFLVHVHWCPNLWIMVMEVCQLNRGCQLWYINRGEVGINKYRGELKCTYVLLSRMQAGQLSKIRMKILSSSYKPFSECL